MKESTLLKLKTIIEDGRIKFESTDKGVAVEYEVESDEIEDIVTAEYGTPTQNMEDLFEVILKRLVKESLNYAKSNSDKLSDL